jgi:hypothetical protein
MAKILFFEKPGCANNTRQKALLAAAGHEVDARNLLTEAWTPERLRPYFGSRPVAEWFNRAVEGLGDLHQGRPRQALRYCGAGKIQGGQSAAYPPYAS